jgi:hypothetical protein
MHDATTPMPTAAAIDRAAHDLRGQLGVLSMGVRLLRSEASDAELVDDLEAATRQLADDLERIVALARSEVRSTGDGAEVTVTELVRRAGHGDAPSHVLQLERGDRRVTAFDQSAAQVVRDAVQHAHAAGMPLVVTAASTGDDLGGAGDEVPDEPQLARALRRACGASLVRRDGRLHLVLPARPSAH